jgi:hypothetical protein
MSDERRDRRARRGSDVFLASTGSRDAARARRKIDDGRLDAVWGRLIGFWRPRLGRTDRRVWILSAS